MKRVSNAGQERYQMPVKRVFQLTLNYELMSNLCSYQAPSLSTQALKLTINIGDQSEFQLQSNVSNAFVPVAVLCSLFDHLGRLLRTRG